MEILREIIQSYSLIEKLKTELRHSWLSSGRQESVAEHTWSMCVLACLCAPYLEHKVNLEKVLKMILVHDLAEAVTGDIPFFEESIRQQNKRVAEAEAMTQVAGLLPSLAGEEFSKLWLEFENLSSSEALFVKAIDNLEVQLQHNLADFATWLPVEQDLLYTKMRPRCLHDSFLSALCSEVERRGEEKMVKAGVDVSSVRKRCSRD